MRRFFLSVFVLGLITWGLPASAQQDCFGPSCSVRGAGTPVPGCNAITAIANVVNGSFTCNPASVVNGTATTAGRSILTIRDTISGSSATSNFLNITGAFPATLSAATSAIYATIAFDNDSQQQAVIRSVSTGTGAAANYTASLWGDSQNTGQVAMGGYFTASGAATTTYGVRSHVTAGGVRVGGEFALGVTGSSAASAALIADNSSVAANIFEARDNGTAVVTIADGGATTFTQQSIHTSGVFVGLNYPLSSAGLGYLYGLTPLTPDAPAWNTAPTSESLHFIQVGDNGFDFNNGACGTSACTDPSLIIHSAVQDTTQYNHLSNWGQAGGAIKTLTESAATSVVRIPIANLAGAFGKFCYTVKAADATDSQIRGSCIKYTVTAKAGTETCSLNTESATVSDASITETEDGSGSGAITTGTLTYAITCDTTPANAVDLQINAVSSLTQTTLNIQYNLNHVGPGQPARQ